VDESVLFSKKTADLRERVLAVNNLAAE
jgi:hypothetical protein